MTHSPHFSQFGGLWTDRFDALEELERRLADGRVDLSLRRGIEDWVTNGYVVLPGAVDPELCDRLTAEISVVCQNGDERYLMSHAGAQAAVPVPPRASTDLVRLVDVYGVNSTAIDVLFSPNIVGFLRAVFDDDALLFQSLTFEKGSQQLLHQDTAYVVVDSPMELAAAWVALEDVTEGSGELMYLEGSHRLPEFLFSGSFKHWNPIRDGAEQHQAWVDHIVQSAEELGLPQKTFLPRRGDVLIWSADLAHGGSPITAPHKTRRSIVGHYCPARASPHYFSYLSNRVKQSVAGGYVASHYYDLRFSDFGRGTPTKPLGVPTSGGPTSSDDRKAGRRVFALLHTAAESLRRRTKR